MPRNRRIKVELRRIATGVSYKSGRDVCIESFQTGEYQHESNITALNGGTVELGVLAPNFGPKARRPAASAN